MSLRIACLFWLISLDGRTGGCTKCLLIMTVFWLYNNDNIHTTCVYVRCDASSFTTLLHLYNAVRFGLVWFGSDLSCPVLQQNMQNNSVKGLDWIGWYWRKVFGVYIQIHEWILRIIIGKILLTSFFFHEIFEKLPAVMFFLQFSGMNNFLRNMTVVCTGRFFESEK